MRLLAGRLLNDAPPPSEAPSSTPAQIGQSTISPPPSLEPIVTATPMPPQNRELSQKVAAIASQVQALNNSVESLTKVVGVSNEKLVGLTEADKIMDTSLKTTNLNLHAANQRILEQGQKRQAPRL